MQAIITKENSLVKAFYTDNVNSPSLLNTSCPRDTFLGNMVIIINNNNFLERSSEHLFISNLHVLLMILLVIHESKSDKPAFRETRDSVLLHQFHFPFTE